MSYRNVLIIILFLFFVFPSEGQRIDSLEALLKGKTGSEKLALHYELTFAYFDSHENSLALKSSKEGYQLALESGDSLMIVKNARLIASTMRRLGQIDSAVLIYRKLLPIIKRNGYNDMLPRILNGLALSYGDKADYDQALDFNFQALDIEQQLHDTLLITVTMNNIGLVYYKLKDYQKALGYFNRTIALKRKIGDVHDMDIVLINTGLSYAYLKDFISAKLSIQEGLRVCGDYCPDYVKSLANFALGVTYYGLNHFDNAERHFLLSYGLAGQVHDIRFQLDNIDYLSQIYIAQSRFDKAVYYLSRAEGLIDNGSLYNLEAIKIYSCFFQLYNKTNDFKNAALYQQKYIQLKDSIYDEGLTTNLMKLEAEHLEKENEARITAQNQILALKEEVIGRQKLLNIFIGAMAIMLILLAAILFKMNRQKQMINGILDQKIAERTKALEDSHGALILANHEQSFIIDRSVSDIQSSLATIKGLCSVGLRDIPNAKEYLSQIDVTSDNLAFTLRNFRELSVENNK